MAFSLLLVDDNPAYRRLTSLLATDALGADADLRQASSLQDALAALADQPADCVLLDLGLPDSQGLGGVRAIRDAGAAAIVVLSGRTDPGLAEEAEAAGAAAFVVKGDELTELGPVLTRIAASR